MINALLIEKQNYSSYEKLLPIIGNRCYEIKVLKSDRHTRPIELTYSVS